jgi:dimethylargininase
VHAKKALVRRPSPRLADGLLTHIERSSVDATSAAKQWEGYVGAFVGAGWRVTEVEPAPECPDSVFVEDTVVVYGDLAVIARDPEPSSGGRKPQAPRKRSLNSVTASHISRHQAC